ncbi:MAG: hypothetical protein LBJ74_05725, partial [Heliobacteriaceae bacterium]|nr:hypothetical protein [Heliobacteriaceae bacterium]
ELAKAAFVSDFKNISGEFDNSNLKILVPATGSVVSNPKLVVKVDAKDITVEGSEIKINNASLISFAAGVTDYMKKPFINFDAKGSLSAADLKKLAGPQAAPFLKASGVIPMKVSLTGTDKKQDFIAQITCDENNYFTPVDIESMLGKQTIMQAKILLKGDRLNIRDTGIFISNTALSQNDVTDMTEVASVSGTISRLNKSVPLINLIKVRIPEELNVSFPAFRDSALKLGGQMFIFANADSPRYRGGFEISGLSIPELFVSMDRASLAFRGKALDAGTEGLVVNDSDMKADMTINLNPSPVLVISNLAFQSGNLDVDKLMKTADAAMKFNPPAKPGTPADIPVIIRDGTVNIARLTANPIVLTDTAGRISMHRNVVYLNNLSTRTFNGVINGNVSANLLNTVLGIRLNGSGINCENALLILANMKDALTGTVSFNTDLTLRGTTMEEQMRTLAGEVNFEIKDGQLGPFGKLENLILAENIRDSEFFQTALGGIINNITSINTSHYHILDGHLTFKNGAVTLDPVTSFGDVLCMHIGGTMNLLTNQVDMKLRARLASQISNLLGPIAAVNPVNLVKVTPGLNFMAAKAFSLFTEQVTQEEIDAIPNFEDSYGVMSTTKFQVVLRGDAAKPLSLVKSFKWLALASEIEQAQEFVSTLPSDEEIVEEQRKEEISKMTTWEKIKIFFTPKSKEKL